MPRGWDAGLLTDGSAGGSAGKGGAGGAGGAAGTSGSNAASQNVRSAEIGDRVLFSPEDRYEVEVGGNDYIMLRERDIHAVAASRIETHTGLYL